MRPLVVALALAASTSALADPSPPTIPRLLRWVRDTTVQLVWPHVDTARDAPAASLPVHPDMVVIRLEVGSCAEEEALSKAIARLGMDVWTVGEGYADIRLARKRIPALMTWLPPHMHRAWQMLVPDMAAAVDDVLNCGECRDINIARDWDDAFFDTYQPLSAVNKWMELMAAMFPSFVSGEEIGSSYEGRPIRALRLATPPSDDSSKTPRKMLVLVGGMHAREWISTSTINYVAWSLISSALAHDHIISALLAEYDVVLIPALNPDGIEFSWDTNRLWRKTRQPTGGASGGGVLRCLGFDLDHAFEYGWDGGNRHNHPCSNTFGGAYGPFEAVEARALADWARNTTTTHHIVGLLDLHSYSQQILYPLAATCDDPPNLENLEELAYGMAKTMRQTHGLRYDVMSACEGLSSQRHQFESDSNPDSDSSSNSDSNPNSISDDPPTLVEYGGGGMVDWFFHYMGAHYSYQLKLRDTGAHGFLLPKEHIRPAGQEVFAALRYMADYLLGNNGIEKAYRPGGGSGPRRTKMKGEGLMPVVDEERWRDEGHVELKRREL